MGYRRALSHPVWNVMQLFGMYVPWNVKVKLDKVTVECNIMSTVPVDTWVAVQMIFYFLLLGCAYAVCYALLYLDSLHTIKQKLNICVPNGFLAKSYMIIFDQC